MDQQKSFIKKFWWIGLIIIILGCGAKFFWDQSHNNYNDNSTHKQQDKEDSGKSDDQSTKSEPRIVATFSPESGTAFQYNPPTIVNNYIYIGTSTKINLETKASDIMATLPDNFFYKMDPDLNVIWSYPLQKTMVDGGATLDSQGNIYFIAITFSVPPGSQDSNGKNSFLTALNLTSLDSAGKFRWQKLISNDGETWTHAMINCAIGTDDTIYVGGRKLFAFDADGNIKWQYPKTDLAIAGMRSSPIIDAQGNVYFISPEPSGNIYGTDVIRAYKFAANSSGTPVWSTELGNNILDNEGGNPNGGGGQKEKWMLSSPAFTAGETSLYVAVGNTINKVEASTGKVLWSMKPDGASGSFKASPAVDAHDTLYIGSKSNTDSNLYAINSDGVMQWKRKMGADMYPSPLLGDDNTLYAGSETTAEGTFHAVDISDGTTKWAIGGKNYHIPDFSFGSPLLLNGYIYGGVFEVRDGDKAFYKIKVDANGYLSGAAWPRFHGGNDNTGRKN